MSRDVEWDVECMIGKHIVLIIVVGGALSALIWQHRPAVWTAMPVAGLGLLGAGFILWSVARIQLGSSFAVTARARRLVTKGLYSRFRNPIYVFGSGVLAGLILFLERPLGLWIFLVIIPLQILRARKESAVLEGAFGEEYRKYRAGTWF
jgi:protein-S-isoprenylcysteine O-methyltransferase Ste14